MARSWSSFESSGASTSHGSGVDRVIETDASQHILPDSFRFGEATPKACMFFVKGLVGERRTYVRRLLHDARRRFPSSGPIVFDYFMDCELPGDATIIRVWRPSSELLSLLLHSLSLVRPPTPRFYYALDDAPRMIPPEEWINAHRGRTIRGANLGTMVAWANFMGSAILLTGNDDVDDYHLHLRQSLASHPYNSNLSQFVVEPWLDTTPT